MSTNTVNYVSSNNLARVRTHVHHGGTGGSSFYVVYLTEQEAYSIIQAEADAIGLRLSEDPFYGFFNRLTSKSRRNAYRIYGIGFGRFVSLPLPSEKYKQLSQEEYKQIMTEGVLWGDFLVFLRERMEKEQEAVCAVDEAVQLWRQGKEQEAIRAIDEVEKLLRQARINYDVNGVVGLWKEQERDREAIYAIAGVMRLWRKQKEEKLQRTPIVPKKPMEVQKP